MRMLEKPNHIVLDFLPGTCLKQVVLKNFFFFVVDFTRKTEEQSYQISGRPKY